MRLFKPIVFVLTLLLLLSACAPPKPVVVTTSPSSSWGFTPEHQVLILQPVVRFERVRDEVMVSVSDEKKADLEESILSTATKVCESRQVPIVACQNLGEESEEGIELCLQLRSVVPKLSKGHVSDKAQKLLTQLGEWNDQLTILANLLHVKVGPGASWNPNTGAITSSMSTSVVHAALFSCCPAQVIWESEVLYRSLPQKQSAGFLQSVESLYQDFPIKTEE